MQLNGSQKKRLASAISEALTFRLELGELRARRRRPTFRELEEELRRLKKSSADLMERDAEHRAIVDRCVSAIEEGLL